MRLDIAVFDRDICTHGFEALDVQIDGPCANRTAPRQRHFSLTKSRQQWAQHQDGSTHRFDQFIGRSVMLDGRTINVNGVGFVLPHSDTHICQQGHAGVNITQARHVIDRHRTICQKSGR